MAEFPMQPTLWASSINEAVVRCGRIPAIVLGAGPSGLAIVRSLGRRNIPVFLLDARPWELAMHSRFAEALVLPDPVKRPERWLDFLEEAGGSLDCKPVVIAAGDPHLMLLADGTPMLDSRYRLAVPPAELTAALLDKRRQYRMLQWVRASDAKLSVVGSPAEMETAYRAMAEAGQGLVVQELIPGGDDSFFGFLSYWDTHGRLLAWCTKRKLRQYPPGFGNGSYQVSVDCPEITEQSIGLLRRLNCRGFASIEYKRDSRDGQMKLMEINPRTISGSNWRLMPASTFPGSPTATSSAKNCRLRPRSGRGYVSLTNPGKPSASGLPDGALQQSCCAGCDPSPKPVHSRFSASGIRLLRSLCWRAPFAGHNPVLFRWTGADDP
jgi:predicted ATP-grasp superfamily ATP-dependent carboligase